MTEAEKTEAALNALPTEVYAGVSVYERDGELSVYRAKGTANSNGLYTVRRHFDNRAGWYGGANIKRFVGRITWEEMSEDD